MRRLVAAAFVTAFAGLAPVAPAEAEPITWTLNCVISNSGCTYVDTTFGTVTLSDNVSTPNAVDVRVDLVGDGINKVLALYLNFDNSDTGGNFYTAAGELLTYSADNEYPSGGHYLQFDLRDRPNQFDPYQTTIFYRQPVTQTVTVAGQKGQPVTQTITTYLEQDLDATMFDLLDASGTTPVAVHIGNIYCPSYGECVPGVGAEEGAIYPSLAVGSTLAPPVAEPASLLLLGTGLLGTGFVARRRKK